jgi:hypothetical protein
MSTVTYKNQPAIHQTRGSVPLAGNSRIYTVNKLLWPPDVEQFIKKQFIGTVLHLCCGKSMLGDIRLDLYQDNIDVNADAANLPFPSRSFNTVLCDPPYNGIFQWNHDMLSEMGRVAQTRFIFQHWFSPVDKLGHFKKDHTWMLSALYAWMPQSYFGRMQIISVFDFQGEYYELA